MQYIRIFRVSAKDRYIVQSTVRFAPLRSNIFQIFNNFNAFKYVFRKFVNALNMCCASEFYAMLCVKFYYAYKHKIFFGCSLGEEGASIFA